MKKTSSLALVAAALVAAVGFSAPAFADEDGDQMIPYNGQNLISSLQAKGIAASDPQVWGSNIRVTVSQADGSSSFQFYDADTFRAVGDNLTTGSIGERNVKRDDAKTDVTSLSAQPVDY